MVVEMEVEVTIKKPFPATFLERDYRILTLRLFNASNIPEAWVGANFTASVPIPRANGEAQGVQLSGKAEQVHTEEKTLPLNWTTSDGQQHATGRSAPFSPEPQHARQVIQEYKVMNFYGFNSRYLTLSNICYKFVLFCVF